MSPVAFQRLAALIHGRSGVVLGPDKLYLAQSRLAPVAHRAGLASLDLLAERSCGDPNGSLANEAVEAMTTNETMFFRDQQPFDDLTRLLPALARQRPENAVLRIWSAAASFGQEAYSIAIVVDEQRAALGGRRVEIIGTDLARAAVERATQGLYSDFEVQRGLSPARRSAHFRREGGQWQVSGSLRRMVQFRTFNLLHDPRALGIFDIVFCRNVLIYFDLDTKRRVLRAVARQMTADGVLYLGSTETLLGLDVGLQKDGIRLVHVPTPAAVVGRMATLQD